MIYELLSVCQYRNFSWVRNSTFHLCPREVPILVFQFKGRVRFWNKLPIVSFCCALICTTKWSRSAWPGSLLDENKLEDVLLGVSLMHSSCKGHRSWDQFSPNINPLKCAYHRCQALSINCYFYSSYLSTLLNNTDLAKVTKWPRQV